MTVPEHLIYPSDVFAADFSRAYNAGVDVWKDAEVAVVGLARNCERPLAGNLSRLVELCSGAKSWQLHIETNDNTDGTEQVLYDFCSQFQQATYTSQTLGRQQFTAEFAGRRTEALAEYRTACQEWVRDHARYADFVVAIDFDSWGGWSHAGFLHGVGELYDSATAYGMASVSLLQWRQDEAGTEQWVHYDAWALRLNSTWDDYTAGQGGWKHAWLPPVGSPPVPVVSAFGGMAIYETGAYLSGTYDGSDCEHVPFHASIAAKTGKSLYLDPAMRTVMKWLE
jgi:hypothetical protein